MTHHLSLHQMRQIDYIDTTDPAIDQSGSDLDSAHLTISRAAAHYPLHNRAILVRDYDPVSQPEYTRTVKPHCQPTDSRQMVCGCYLRTQGLHSVLGGK